MHQLTLPVVCYDALLSCYQNNICFDLCTLFINASGCPFMSFIGSIHPFVRQSVCPFSINEMALSYEVHTLYNTGYWTFTYGSVILSPANM